MRRFTFFTLAYLAAGVCLTAIALKYPNITPNLKTILLIEAGMLYTFSIFSTSPFWRQTLLQSQNKLRQQATWKKKFLPIALWLGIGLTIFSSLFNLVVNHYWTTEAIGQAALGLMIILPSAENLFLRSQTQS
ncbi:hypothetical protein [Nostoc sp. NMS4]|uniref:hypothetical protein n=1 Tax=Nostoc sp. NMS4 TaxID=2815390 RepID=UPI0025CC2BA0|nr:hypothetical protein [Nostoc sp. NMS4]MBN3925052.1 hypothetical protein [Nostoc sp. NMS4]